MEVLGYTYSLDIFTYQPAPQVGLFVIFWAVNRIKEGEEDFLSHSVCSLELNYQFINFMVWVSACEVVWRKLFLYYLKL